MCVNFILEWRDLQFNFDSERQIFEKIFHGRFIYTQSFCQKSAERKSPKKYFSYFILDDWPGIRTQVISSNKPSHYTLHDTGNYFGTPAYPMSMRSPAQPLDIVGPRGIYRYYSNLIVTSAQSQWPCLQVTVLWEDTRKECSYHLTICAMDADPLRRRRLFSTFFHGTGIGYLALQSLSAWRRYHPLMSII